MSNDGEKGSGYWVLDHLPDLHSTVTMDKPRNFGLWFRTLGFLWTGLLRVPN